MLRAFLTAIVAALALATPAAAIPTFGATEDRTKFAEDGGETLYRAMHSLGMTENRIAVTWNADEPDVIQGEEFLHRSLPLGANAGIRTVLSVYPDRSLALATDTQTRIALYTAYLQKLARTFPQVRDFVIGNEPNQPRFWRPQFSRGGSRLSAAAYEPLLAAGYDALKSVDPSINVIGVGLSPRGNDNPKARDNRSTSPVRFLQALGEAYRDSGRTAPLMDQLAFHPYPNRNTDPPGKGYRWPNAGVPNLDRIKQAVWDAFHGTAQPTFAEAGQGASIVSTAPALTFRLDEIGWQVGVGPSLGRRYFGTENVPAISEEQQARYYDETINLLACDPTVESILFFHLVDEPDLGRFQSGLLRLDGTRRPSFEAVRRAILAAGGCAVRHLWRHTTRIVGARAQFAVEGGRIRVATSAREAGEAQVAVVPVGTGIARALDEASPAVLRQYRSLTLAPAAPLPPGRYVAAVRITAETNRERSTTLRSGILRVS